MLALLVIILIAAVVAIFVGAPARLTALIAAVANIGLAVAAAVMFHTTDFAEFQASSWHVSVPALDAMGMKLNLSFGFLNGISVVMALLTALVTFAAVFTGKCPEGKEKLWFNSILLIAAGGMGAFLSLDLFFFYAFHELALIPTFLMIGILGRGERKSIAWKATVYLAAGSIVLLAGLVWLAQIAGTFDIAQLVVSIKTQLQGPDAASIKTSLYWISGLLILGFGTLVSLFPFHSWAAPAYASAPAPVAMLHSGVLKKFGLYGLIQIAIVAFPAQFAEWTTPLLVLLLGNIIWVGLVTINQKRLDLMLGNSSVMHMGYIFLAIAAYAYDPSNELAIPAAALLMFAHGISIALSFSLTDVIERKTGSLELNQLGGLAKSAPNLAFIFGLVAMASIGLPGLANFAGEVMVFFSGFHGYEGKFGPIQIATIIAIWGVVISAVYMLRAFKSTFHGPMVEATRNASDISICEKIPAALLAIALLVVGIYPNILLQFITK